MPDDFKQAIEEVKLRIPIEEIVRERVAGLRKAGALWEACCPFHEERTPSFKVHPGRGTWHCFGACGRGGDVLSFVQEFDKLDFMEALEILAARAGVELPRRSRSSREGGRYDELYDVIERASALYSRALRGNEGRRALDYLEERGFEAATIEAFGIGYSPASGQELVERARSHGVALERLIDTGLARRNDRGRAYDFFRGRMMIPIRDLRGRTVGFGARRLDEDARSPKYVNTSETPLFRKSQLIYGLDLAIDHVRRGGHLVLVEGYTDVMAAHQVGLRSVVAVLGTSTTEEHAALVRRTGARRVTLCFDGDEAGALATMRALSGLLPLEVDLDVVRLEDGFDPCDRLLAAGPAALEERFDSAIGWLDFALGRVRGLSGRAYWECLDQVLELVARLRRPMERDATLARIAEALDASPESVRAQFQDLPGRKRERARAEREAAEAERAAREAEAVEESEPVDEEAIAVAPPRVLGESERAAWRHVTGALLLQPRLAERVAEAERKDPGGIEDLRAVPELHAILSCVLALAEDEQDGVGVDRVMTELGADPARDWVVPLLEEAETADNPETLIDGALDCLRRQREKLRIRAQVESLPSDGEALDKRLAQLHEELRRSKDSVGVQA